MVSYGQNANLHAAIIRPTKTPLKDLHQHTSYSLTVHPYNTNFLCPLIDAYTEVREELRPLKLTFTEIAKRVGESWQVLVAEEKEPYESQALAAKEKHHAEMVKYKKTDEYKEYCQYLAEFKAKSASSTGTNHSFPLDLKLDSTWEGLQYHNKNDRVWRGK